MTYQHFAKYFENINNPLEFIDNFWGIKPTEKDIDNVKIFLEVINQYGQKLDTLKISKLVNKSKRTIDKWIYKINLPIIIRLLEKYIELNKPKKGKWLSLNSTRGGLFTGPWIYVPEKINNYQDIYEVINQLKSLPESYEKLKQFDIDVNFLKENRHLFFAYLLGIMIGDASKYGFQRKQRMMRRIQLKLTQKHKSNERLGNFVGLCINVLGLKYYKCKDTPPSKKNKYNFYSWNSQSSLLFQWIFRTCLGLNDNEKTSYDPIKANWILDSPKEFKIWFLQGIADSDGYVDINTFQVGIVSKPNIDFIQKILNTLNIKSSKTFLHKGTLFCLRFNLKTANELPIFNNYVKLYRYNLMKRLIDAKKYSHHWPEWLGEEVDNYIKNNFSSTKIMRIILDKYDIAIRAGGIGKRIKKYKIWQRKKLSV